MVVTTPSFDKKFLRLLRLYRRENRREAFIYLLQAAEDAKAAIAADPDGGEPYPSVYDDLVKPGRLWVYKRRYWFAYRPVTPFGPLLVGVFYETEGIQKNARNI